MTIATRILAAALGLGTALIIAQDAGSACARANARANASESSLAAGNAPTSSPSPSAAGEIEESLTFLPAGYRFRSATYLLDERPHRVRLDIEAIAPDGGVIAGLLSVSGLRLEHSEVILERHGSRAVCARRVPVGLFGLDGSRLEPTQDCRIFPTHSETGPEELRLSARLTRKSHDRLASR